MYLNKPTQLSGAASLVPHRGSIDAGRAAFPRAPIAACLSPSVLSSIADPWLSLAIWRRLPLRLLSQAIGSLVEAGPFSVAAEGAPEEAARAVTRNLPAPAMPLRADFEMLGSLFATITGRDAVRLRLEHVGHNACRRRHVDAVRLRLLCTYAGLGTEWLEPGGSSRRMAPFHVGIFKGASYPDRAPRVLHRSPPVEHLPPGRRPRLLLCIDEAGAF